MADLWTSPLPWAPHQRGLARWAADRWGWTPGDPDWPSALALVSAAEDEGHTVLDWARAPDLWERRFGPGAPAFTLPGPDLWPRDLFQGGWLVQRSGAEGLVQTARNAALEDRLFTRLEALADPPGAAPGHGQEAAVARAGKTRFLVLAGGPGTGKTTTLKNLVSRWREGQPGLRVAVAAPTGRAAARAREAFSQEPSPPESVTLHRLLGLRPGLGDPWHGPHRPLPFDLVIVDEASMVDLRTAMALVEALAPGTALVLVGDPGQLPSVDAGSVLADVLGHPRFTGSVVRLTVRHRLQRESQALAQVFDLLQDPQAGALAIADDLARLGDGRHPDFRWEVTAEDEDPTARAVAAWGSARDLTAANLGERILLSPVHRGPGGTLALGAFLDRSLGRSPGTIEGGLPWMIRHNLPHLELSNGDRGLVVRNGGQLWFEVGARRWPFALVGDDGEPAWAVSVHKSQGSEYDRVILVLPPGSSPGTVRELLYTGLTRARKGAVLVGSKSALVLALGRDAVRVSGFGRPRWIRD